MADPSTDTVAAEAGAGTPPTAAEPTTSTTSHGSGRSGGRSGGRNGGRGYRNHNKPSSSGGNQLIDSLREACPAHKQNELAELVASFHGDEEKIRQRISEWWEEPVIPSEGDWEEINKKSSQSKFSNATSSKNHSKSVGGRGRGFDGGRGRSAARGGGREGRGREGRGREGRGRGRGERGASVPKETITATDEIPPVTTDIATLPTVEETSTQPIRPPQGAWAAKTSDTDQSAVANNNRENVSPAVIEVTIPEIVPALAPVVNAPTPVAPVPNAPKGNVWATKGSAHLIKAEKPAPPKPIVPPTPILRKANNVQISNSSSVDHAKIATVMNRDVDVHAVTSMIQDNVPVVAPPSSSVPEPVVVQPVLPALPNVPSVPVGLTSGLTSSSLTTSTLTTSNTPAINAWNQDSQPNQVVPSVIPVSSVPEPKPTPVLNMGRWETGDTDDDLNFGFGTFGTDSATADLNDTHIDSTSNNATTSGTTATSAASPARPPPGLSMSGMPPMPANAVLVHELENKLEEVSISKPQQQAQDNQTSLSSFAPAHQTQYGAPQMHDSSLSSQPLYGGSHYNNPTGAMGMYGNYNTPGVGGPAIPNQAFIPGSGSFGVTQPSKPSMSQQQQQQQQSLYNAAPSPGNVPALSSATGVTGVGVGSNDTSAAATNLPSNTGAPSTMPPGMAGAIPYGNQMYYSQQQFVHQPNIGYNYGYGNQFGGGVQSGFGYPGGMHSNAGYGHGGPAYDDHTGAGGSAAHGTLPGSSAVGGLGGYDPQQQQPKNTGGYRGGGGGRHNNNQYQQYNPQQQHHQHGGYGQPYNMGYQQHDHFNQRGGYQNMQDPYAMQQQQQGVGGYGGGGFQGDNQYKGKKNNRSGGLNQFQQQGPSIANQNQHISGQQQQQQPFGIQGQSGAGNDANQPSTDGWSNQNVGWSGGAGSGWQPK